MMMAWVSLLDVACIHANLPIQGVVCVYGQVCQCDCDCGSCSHLLLLKHVLIVLLFGVVTKGNISRQKTQGVFLPVHPQPGNTRGLQCSSRFPLVVPVRLGFFCLGLARPDISNRFRCDPILDRKQAGGARFLKNLGHPGHLYCPGF